MTSPQTFAVLAFFICAPACNKEPLEDQAGPAEAPARFQHGQVKLSADERAALDLQVAVAEDADLPDVSMRFGQVIARLGQETLVMSPIAGRVPKPPFVNLGAEVSAGTALLQVVPVLAAVERITMDVRGAEYQGQIEATQRELVTRRAALERARELASSKIVSQAKLQEAETAVATTASQLESLKRATAVQTGVESAPITLRAPTGGKVATLNASVGAVVHQGDLLIRLSLSGPTWVDVAVPPEEPVGLAYEVLVGSEWIPARLLTRGSLVEADGTRHDRTEVDAVHAAMLLAGQVVSVRVARAQSRGIVVPESAIVPGVDHDVVFVESLSHTFTPVEVQVAARFGARVRVRSGIAAGARVVVRGGLALQGEARRAELGTAD